MEVLKQKAADFFYLLYRPMRQEIAARTGIAHPLLNLTAQLLLLVKVCNLSLKVQTDSGHQIQ